MPGDPSPPRADRSQPFEEIRAILENDPRALGESLLVLGSGPIAVEGAAGAVVTLDARGAGVLIPVFESVPEGASAELADALEHLAHVSPAELAGQAPARTLDPEAVVQEHAELFKLPQSVRPELNRRQRAIVVLTERASPEVWRDLRADLGAALSRVLLWEDSRLTEQELPPELAVRLRSRGLWAWMAGVAAVAALAGLWLGRALDEDQTPPGVTGPLISAGAVVAAGVGSDATHTQWIGQRRIARTSVGRLVAVHASNEGLQVVRDQGNQGVSWEAPQLIREVVPLSMSIALDASDRLHIAFRDAQGVGYVTLSEREGGFVPGPVVRLDTAVVSPVVDVAFDSSASLAHVVWVKGDKDQQPFWAAVSAPTGGEPRIVGSEPLATTGNVLSVLVNVAVSPSSQVLATYRRGDSLEGWFSRRLDAGDPGVLTWSTEERLPTPDALYGAASLGIDRTGTAHLVLRDNTTYGLTYLSRASGSWGPVETIVDAGTTEEIDFPSLSADSASGLLYVFFQDTRTTGRGVVKAAIRDPAAGWTFPASVGSTDQLFYPTSIASAAGNAVVLATAQETPQIRAFRVGLG